MASVFFCAGFALGLIVAVPIVTIFWIGAKKAAEIKAKGELLDAKVALLNSRKKVDASIEKLRAGNPEMTREQEEMARKELEQVFISRYQGKPGQQVVPAHQD